MTYFPNGFAVTVEAVEPWGRAVVPATAASDTDDHTSDQEPGDIEDE